MWWWTPKFSIDTYLLYLILITETHSIIAVYLSSHIIRNAKSQGKVAGKMSNLISKLGNGKLCGMPHGSSERSVALHDSRTGLKYEN